MKAALLALACLTAAACAHAAEPMLTDAAQDGTGRVWAAPYDEADVLYVSEGAGWKRVEIAPAGKSKAVAIRLAPAPDGAVLCFWKGDAAHGDFVTRHRGMKSEAFARFPDDFRGYLEPDLFVDSSSRVWLLEMRGKLHCVTAEHQLELKLAMPLGTYWFQGEPQTHDTSYTNKLGAVEDSHGRVWFFNCGAVEDNATYLPGAMVFDGQAFAPRTIGAEPGRGLSSMARGEGELLRAAVYGDGVYDIDAGTLEATRLAEPEPHALEHVAQIFRVGSSWYFVCERKLESDLADGHDVRPRTALWRLQDGVWKKVIAGLDVPDSFNPMEVPRAWVETPDALLVGSNGLGVWSIPRDGAEPVALDWRHGFASSRPAALFRAGENVVATSMWGKPFIGLLSTVQPRQRAEIIRSGWPLAYDARGHAFAILPANLSALAEWDGEKWAEHSLPAGLGGVLRYLDADDAGRIWLVPHETKETTLAIYTPVEDRWETFPSYRAALEAQARGARMAPRHWSPPAFSADGQIAYAERQLEVARFDGKEWRTWNWEELHDRTRLPPQSLPFFDAQNQLCVNFEHGTRKFAGAGWKDVARVAAPERASPPWILVKEPTMPRGCKVASVESLVNDQSGSTWLIAQGELHKARAGLCAAVFAPGERHPFRDLRKLHEAFTDARGNTFLLAAPTHLSRIAGGEPSPPYEYVLLRSRRALPDTQITLERKSEDAFTARLSANGEGTRWFQWRLDGAAWSEPAEKAQLELSALALGEHRLEAIAIDDELRSDPTPAVVTLQATLDPARQLAGLIAALNDPDFAKREAAVAALAKKSGEALPALRAAREKAPESQRWWIDAALQECARPSR